MEPENAAEAENVQDPAVTVSETREEQPRETPSEPSTQGEGEASAHESASPHMPDPSALVAMAAMHMQTLDLLQVLLTVFDAHAWRSMGLVADHTGEINKDLPSAQTSIDCLAFVLGKVEGTLEASDKHDIQRRLTDLRMNYVAKVREG